MKIATQDDIDRFLNKALLDDSIYPYLTTSKYNSHKEVYKGDWDGIQITNEQLTFYACIAFDRTRDIEAAISLYTLNPIAAGRALFAIEKVLKRYKPRAINSVVHSSNNKSIKINKRLLGDPWGVEKLGAWNSLTGQYEDLVYFRKVLDAQN